MGKQFRANVTWVGLAHLKCQTSGNRGIATVSSDAVLLKVQFMVCDFLLDGNVVYVSIGSGAWQERDEYENCRNKPFAFTVLEYWLHRVLIFKEHLSFYFIPVSNMNIKRERTKVRYLWWQTDNRCTLVLPTHCTPLFVLLDRRSRSGTYQDTDTVHTGDTLPVE